MSVQIISVAVASYERKKINACSFEALVLKECHNLKNPKKP